MAEDTTSPVALMPCWASLCSTSPIGRLELLVQNTTVSPARRRLSTAAAAPAMGWSPSQITPSRSSAQVTAQPWQTRDVARFEPFPGIRYDLRSEEHTSELQSLMRISYAVFCLKKKTHSS